MAKQQWVRHHPHVMVMQPVLELFAADDFALWPVGEHASYGHFVLNGETDPAEVGTAAMRIAAALALALARAWAWAWAWALDLDLDLAPAQ
ncbi:MULTISPECIES: hypothetical protein [unclassified Streptomyces]|uniref:hypothetical protein n=1 Tax=unclassified Streptomyces TaxID=2593676 RepID=UPI0037A8CBB2